MIHVEMGTLIAMGVSLISKICPQDTDIFPT
jgi:hypothetical protein